MSMPRNILLWTLSTGAILHRIDTGCGAQSASILTISGNLSALTLGYLIKPLVNKDGVAPTGDMIEQC